MKNILTEEYFEEEALNDEEHYWFHNGLKGGYHRLVDSMGYEVLFEEHDDDYSGDSFYLLKDDNKYGILIFGWGSCSGCDALEACQSPQEVVELRDELHNSIQWFTYKGGLRDYVRKKDWETEYYWHNDAGRKFVNRLNDFLGVV